MDEARFFISPESVYERLGSPAAPLIVDVRPEPAFAEAGQVVVAAIRRAPETVEAWASGIPAGRSVAVYCVRSHEVSQNTAVALRDLGIDAHYLEGGIEAWAAAGLPLRNKAVKPSTRWVTREGPKIDRITCPWLLLQPAWVMVK